MEVGSEVATLTMGVEDPRSIRGVRENGVVGMMRDGGSGLTALRRGRRRGMEHVVVQIDVVGIRVFEEVCILSENSDQNE